jgi:hypothetical protein
MSKIVFLNKKGGIVYKTDTGVWTDLQTYQNRHCEETISSIV